MPDDILPGLSTRALERTDAEAVFELTRACEQHATGQSLVELDDILGDWAAPSYDLGAQSIGFFEGDTLVAYGEVDRKRLEGHVAVARRGLGIGTALFAWAIEKARELGYDRLGQSLPITNGDAIALVTRQGGTLLWTSWILELPAGAPIESVDLASGHRLRDFDVRRDARDAYQTIEDAFNEWPNREASTFEDWFTKTIERDDFDPWNMLLVLEAVGDHERVVGACKVSVVDGMGWVDQIAVRRESRGRGLGRALLVTAFARAREHGATTTRLNTDSRTGALGLYEHVGMVAVETSEHLAVSLA